MKDISLHCSVLSKLISGFEHEIEWTRSFEWLNIASGITNVDIDTIRFNTCFGYCSEADYSDIARDKLLEIYITELTRFLYVWGCLESLIDEINPDPAPHRGKINSICYYMQNRLTCMDTIYPYSKELNDLLHVLNSSEVDEPSILNRFNTPFYVSKHGVGLYVIYKLRNQLSHGSITFPNLDENNKPKSNYIDLISLSTRIILLTIQMILLAFYMPFDFSIPIFWEEYDIDANEDEEGFGYVGDIEYNIKSILYNIHLKTPYYNYPIYEQMKLWH